MEVVRVKFFKQNAETLCRISENERRSLGETIREIITDHAKLDDSVEMMPLDEPVGSIPVRMDGAIVKLLFDAYGSGWRDAIPFIIKRHCELARTDVYGLLGRIFKQQQ